MLVERVLGNLEADAAPAGVTIDWLDLTWSQCIGRALRGTTRGGRMIRVLLPVGFRGLRHGDILYMGVEKDWAAVHVLPTSVLVAPLSDPVLAARVALELGNLHVPVEIGSVQITVLPDSPTEAVFRRYGVTARPELRRFQPDPCSTRAIPLRSPRFEIARVALDPR
jgi:urease accessory protein UreE